jgi:hypothetical protein
VDEDDELRNLKRLLVAGLVFLVSGWFAFGELRYWAFGETADATITEVKETSQAGRRGRSRPMLAVRYSFPESGGATRSERDDVPPDWTPPGGASLQPGSKVKVQYLPGVPDKSRLAGHATTLPLLIFVACLVAIVGFGIWLWRHAYQAVHSRPARRRR